MLTDRSSTRSRRILGRRTFGRRILGRRTLGRRTLGRRTLGWTLTCLWLLAPAARAQSSSAGDARGPRGAEVLEQLSRLRATHELPALAGLLIEDGRVVGVAAVGSRAVGGSAAVSLDDPWHLGSCTKAMTATLIGRLVEQGALRWATTLGEVFADQADAMHPAWRGVTVEQLLSHRSGAPADLHRDGLWGRLFMDTTTPAPELRRVIVAEVTKHAPLAPPGERYLYSNAGYAIAGAVAEQVTGQAYDDLLGEALFAPLGMTRAGFGPPGTPEALDAPLGHRRDGRALRPMDPGAFGADNPPAIAPAGTVHAPLDDWARFALLHLRGARGALRSDDPLRSPATFEQLHFPRGAERYALGWGATTRDWAGGRVLSHSGSNTMWFATIVIAPDADAAALVATNCGGEPAERACGEAVKALIALARD